MTMGILMGMDDLPAGSKVLVEMITSRRKRIKELPVVQVQQA